MTNAFESVTVIVPCYRCVKTLRRAVESALADAPAGLELLLVDDGSDAAQDDTAAVCDALAAEFPAVTALHRANGGAGAARSTGLDAAHGDWVLFLDADDALLPGLWAALAALEFDAEPPDLVLFGMERASTGPVENPLAPGLYRGAAALGSALAPLLFESGYLAAPYPKLFRRAAVGALRFDKRLQINEDVLFNIIFLQNSTAIYCLNGVYYKQYDLEPGSLSRRLRGDLLDAEIITRPVLAVMLAVQGVDGTLAADILRQSRVRAALNQYDLLTGRPGAMPFAERRSLFGRILADGDAREALRQRLTADRHPLLALPYRLGVAAKLPGLLAGYTLLKNKLL